MACKFSKILAFWLFAAFSASIVSTVWCYGNVAGSSSSSPNASATNTSSPSRSSLYLIPSNSNSNNYTGIDPAIPSGGAFVGGGSVSTGGFGTSASTSNPTPQQSGGARLKTSMVRINETCFCADFYFRCTIERTLINITNCNAGSDVDISLPYTRGRRANLRGLTATCRG